MRLLLSGVKIMLLAVLTAMGLLTVWPDAQAITISNLDDETHKIIFEPTPGRRIMKEITPGHTIRALQHTGTVSIKGKPHRIPVRTHDRLVIWGDGNLQVQMRRQSRGDVF